MTRDEAVKPLPCPFCGGAVELDTRRAYRSLEGRLGNAVAIYCTKCPADQTVCHADHPNLTVEEMVAELIASWNTRAALTAPPPSEGDVAELLDECIASHRRLWNHTGDGCEGRSLESEADASRAAVLARMAAPKVQEGWKMVPVEPTAAMLSAGDSQMPQIAPGQDVTTGYDALPDVWRDMLAAAPTPLAQPDPEGAAPSGKGE